jgi:hypothetical protein
MRIGEYQLGETWIGGGLGLKIEGKKKRQPMVQPMVQPYNQWSNGTTNGTTNDVS